MSALSLDASLRTCKVNTGEATRIQTDRFFNPNNMICIPWNGYNLKGQRVCADSFYTKRAGCNSAMDRVSVENFLRPDYSDYINFNMAGIEGNIYGNRSAWKKTGAATSWEQGRHKVTGSYGNQFQATNIPSCSVNAYARGMAQVAQANRQASAHNQGYKSSAMRQASGGCPGC